jgi:5-methylcytosine-specific restriction enzyme subunit McrC
MNSEIVLGEYESKDVELDAEGARALSLAAGDRVDVAFAPARGQWVLTAKQFVGTLVAGGVQVRVRPKVPLENLFALLDVGVPSSAWAPEAARYASDRDLLPAVASFFARSLDRALNAGLHRAYREERERVSALRGRLDFPELLRRPGQAIPIPSRYDDFTPDIELNRLLRNATTALLRVPSVPEATRRSLMRQLTRFEGVAEGFVDPTAIDRFHFDRLTARFEAVARLGALVLRGATLLHRYGGVSASAFLLDMNDLFQRFVTDRLARALRGRLEVTPDPRSKMFLGQGRKVTMYPDLLFRKDGSAVYVGDVKYKVSVGTARNADYYQLLAYLTATHLQEGVLIYCRTDGDDEPYRVVVKPSGQRLDVYRVNLTGTADALEESLKELALHLVERTSVATAS